MAGSGAEARRVDWTWLAVVPAAGLLGGLLVLPATLGLLGTFTNYAPFGGPWEPVGLANYQAALADPGLATAFGNAAVLTAAAVPLEIGGGLALALALRRPFRGRSLVRVLLLVPWLISPIAAGVMWHFLFSSQAGIAGTIAAWLGGSAASPLADPRWALPAVTAVEVWRLLPLAAFLLLPGVLAVPQEELDFATLVGSRPWTTLYRVVLPRIRVLLLTVGLLLGGASLSAVDTILVLTRGGPGSQTVTPALYSYTRAVEGHDWPLATTTAWLLTGVILLLGQGYLAGVGRDSAGPAWRGAPSGD